MTKKVKLTFRTEEVVAFLEERILDGISKSYEDVLYEDYCVTGKLERGNALKNVLRTMKREWEM